MNPEPEPPEAYERHDVDVLGIVLTVLLFALSVCLLLLALWGLSCLAVPESIEAGASPPVRMPGQPAVGERLQGMPPPRLEGLGGSKSAEPTLSASFEWVNPKKGIARIPVDSAMDAVVESSRKKGGGR